MGQGDRLDGWKAIAAYFGRDRTTVIRWAQERGLPVRHVPGGKTKTVFALRSELDAWTSETASTQSAEPTATAASFVRPRYWLFAIIGLVLLAGLLLVQMGAPSGKAVGALPADPALATLYVQARDNWGQRNAAGIVRAIAELETVTRADPGFAPGHSALADALLLAREFGSLPDMMAFSKARFAAETALRLDPNLASAYRALGFVAYWWEHDRISAGRAFRRAIALDPDAAQTRFWYGNILADNGEPAAALRELNAARLADPGSIAIDTDLAWALWSSGQTEAAIARLRAILARSPDFAVAHDCLSLIALAQGDYVGYLKGLGARQRARAAPQLAAQAAALEQAMTDGGVPAVKRALLDQALAAEAGVPFPNHAWAAFVASTASNRPALLGILQRAERQREVWGSAGFTARIARQWHADRAILTLLERRAGPKIEPAA